MSSHGRDRRNRIVAIVLAGGRSARFGRDKRTELLNGLPLFHRPLQAVANVAAEIVLVVAPGETAPGRLPDLSVPIRVVHDRLAHAGPLAGLLAGLDAATDSTVALVVGVDMPWLEPRVLARLVEAARTGGRDAWILDAGGAIQQSLPLAGRSGALRSAARGLLQRGDRSLRGLLIATSAGRVPEAEWRALDPGGGSVRDVDRPEDLAAVPGRVEGWTVPPTERITIAELLEAARAGLDRIDPAGALAAQQAGALLIDTRAADVRRETGIIPGSVHVPLSVLYWRLDPSSESADPALADLDRQVVLVCAHGYSSSLAAATLRQLGFSRATDVVGGFDAWAAAGLPVAPAPDSGR